MVLASTAVVISARPASAQPWTCTKTWVGTAAVVTDAAWTATANWAPNGAPGPADTACFGTSVTLESVSRTASTLRATVPITVQNSVLKFGALTDLTNWTIAGATNVEAAGFGGSATVSPGSTVTLHATYVSKGHWESLTVDQALLKLTTGDLIDLSDPAVGPPNFDPWPTLRVNGPGASVTGVLGAVTVTGAVHMEGSAVSIATVCNPGCPAISAPLLRVLDFVRLTGTSTFTASSLQLYTSHLVVESGAALSAGALSLGVGDTVIDGTFRVSGPNFSLSNNSIVTFAASAKAQVVAPTLAYSPAGYGAATSRVINKGTMRMGSSVLPAATPRVSVENYGSLETASDAGLDLGSASLTNSGTFTVQSGRLTVGDFTNTATGKINVKTRTANDSIAPTPIVATRLLLGGTLQVTMKEMPKSPTWEALRGLRSGTFQSVSFPTQSGTVLYSNNNVAIQPTV